MLAGRRECRTHLDYLEQLLWAIDTANRQLMKKLNLKKKMSDENNTNERYLPINPLNRLKVRGILT
jgi:hypothetical protein